MVYKRDDSAPPRQYATAALAVLIPGLGAILVGILSLAGVHGLGTFTAFWSAVTIFGGVCFAFLGVRGAITYLRARRGV